MAVGSLVLCGCAAQQRAEVASRAQTELVGMSKVDLFQCAGVPLRQERLEGLEFLTFAGGGDSVGSAVATGVAPGTAVATGKSSRRYCEATFVLKDGIVQKVNYQAAPEGCSRKGSSAHSLLKTA
jgi:hypothetical protein